MYFILALVQQPTTEQQDFFQRISDFIRELKGFFGTGLSNLDTIPEVFQAITEWVTMTFDFIPPYFVALFSWFIIACMLIRFLRW